MNRCNTCGRFKPWRELGPEHEHQELDLHGNLTQEWWRECLDCIAATQALSSAKGAGSKGRLAAKESEGANSNE